MENWVFWTVVFAGSVVGIGTKFGSGVFCIDLACIHGHWIKIYVAVAVLTVIFLLASIFIAFQPSRFEGDCIGGANKVAVVTGGASGLGQDIWRSLHAKGVQQIVVLDINVPLDKQIKLIIHTLQNVKQGNTDTKSIDPVKYIQVDVSKEDELGQCMASLQQDLWKQKKYISILINNAGIDARGPLVETWPDIKQVFSVNLFSHYWMLKAVLKFRQEHQMTAKEMPFFVVAISLVLGHLAPRNLSLYSSLKAAVTQLYEGLYQEIRGTGEAFGILVVSPGQLDLRMFEDIDPSNRYLAPIVNSQWLASVIADRVAKGHTGVLCAPIYANFLPVVKVMPVFLQQFCRWFADMDNKI